jgi:MFS superfamily sulfate permease-like transporter
MLFFADMLAYLPNAALAGIVANAVLSIIEVPDLRELWRTRRSEFAIALVCLLSVLALGPLKAVIIAFLLTTIDIVRRASRPGTWVLREAPDCSHFIPQSTDVGITLPGLIIYRFGAPLYFANATQFVEEIKDLIDTSPTPLHWLVLDAEAITDIDTAGAAALGQMLKVTRDRGVRFAIARPGPSLPAMLENYELMSSIGMNHLYPTNRHAAAAYRQERDVALVHVHS